MRILIATLLVALSSTAFAVCPDPVPSDTMCLQWETPTTNTDDSPLTDLEGFEVYWGFEPGVFSEARKIDIPDENSNEFTSPAASVNIPVPQGGGSVEIFFVMTAYDTGVLPGPEVNCAGRSGDDQNDPDNEVDCREVSNFSNQVAKVFTFPDVEPNAPRIINIVIDITTSS